MRNNKTTILTKERFFTDTRAMAQKSFSLLSFLMFGILLCTSVASKADAATLSNFSDRVTTSRPSPSTVITGEFGGGLTIADNKSRFLASDSAQMLHVGTGAIADTETVIFQSSDLLNLYFTNDPVAMPSGTHVVTTPITATHKLQFTTANAIPTNGDIEISFEGTGVTVASPSATTFSFNGLTTANASTNIMTNNATCSWTITAPNLTCNLTSGITSGTTVTILIGCTAQSGGNCTTSAPRLINPTKGAAAAGTADLWKVDIETQDASDVALDEGTATIGVIEAVEVKAEVDPTLTFTIAPVNNAVALSTVATGCSDTTNSGFNSTATLVDLGILSAGTINISAQELLVSTNASGGYVISATSSGQFINPATGFVIPGLNSNSALSANDTPAPATFGASGVAGFGISPCGTRVNTTLWGSGATAFSSGSKYSNPYNSGVNSYYATIASFTGTTGVSLDDTVVRYASTVSGTTPAGIYRNYFTYVATATF